MNRNGHDERLTTVDVDAPAEIQRWLEQEGPGLFPEHCVMVVQRYDQSVTSLPEVADASLENAVEKRRREFSAGRIAAAAALKKILGGDSSTAIAVGAGRNPVWPTGIAGSITHTAGLAIAVVARTDIFASVGIDLELTNAVQPELWPSILQPNEIDFVSSKPPAEQARWATILFCAKESFYKMQYPLTSEWVDFHDAEILVSESGGNFELTCSQTSVVRKLKRAHFAGRYLAGPKFSLTAVWLAPAQINLPAT
jgi:4'-phosphopantetheinyl transferase EntD